MKKETFYQIAIGILILLNLLQLGGRWMHHRPPGGMRQKVVNHLNLDAQQEQQFFDLVKNHRMNMMQLQKKQQQLTQSYFAQPSDTLLQQSMNIEREKIEITEQHFANIKSILQEDQYADFEAFKKRAINHILRSTPRKRPPRK